MEAEGVDTMEVTIPEEEEEADMLEEEAEAVLPEAEEEMLNWGDWAWGRERGERWGLA